MVTPTMFPELDPDEQRSNDADNRPFGAVVEARLSRRNVLRGGAIMAAAGFLTLGNGLGTGASGALAAPPAGAANGNGRAARSLLGFPAVLTGTADTIVVPDGYVAEVLIPWGEPIRTDGPAWKADASNTAAEQAEQIGMHHDGMHFFPLGDGRRGNENGLLVLNHEYVDQTLLSPDGAGTMTQAKVDKALAAHGVSVVNVALVGGRWQRIDSNHNRRITGTTSMAFSGPVGGDHPRLRTSRPVGGTLNNCSHGVTPWGTYLTCEENWNGYFGTQDTGWVPDAEERRYGINANGFGYRWAHGGRAVRRGPQPQRTAPVRLGRRDRPDGPDEHAGEAHRDGPLQARGRHRHRVARPRRGLQR